MVNLQSNGEQLLVVYGGRNESIFPLTCNVALNDICIYNINKNMWEALALFGQMPCSRYSHFITQYYVDSNYETEGFLMLGGVNLK
jgi:Galactose oxidase, central domain